MNQEHDDKILHRQEVEKQLSPMGRMLFKYIEFDKDEKLITEIRKHPIGIVFISATGVSIASILLVALIGLALNADSLGLGFGENINSGLKSGLVAGGLILALITLAVTAITVSIYRRSVVYVTDEKVAQVMYVSILNRKVTQLSIGNVEDVTVTQKGLLSRIFHYGTLLIETAGELPNSSFTFVPKPYDNAHKIIEAHEAYVELYGN